MAEGVQAVGVILAGGLSRRMGGGDKALRELAGQPALNHVIERCQHQVETLLLNINGGQTGFAHFGLPMAADVFVGHAGPLAGILTGMQWAARVAPSVRWIVSLPCDAPFLPRDLVDRFMSEAAKGHSAVICARSAGRDHPVIALWQVALAADLEEALKAGERKIDAFTANYRVSHMNWSSEPYDPFLNLNRPGDFEKAAGIIRAAE